MRYRFLLSPLRSKAQRVCCLLLLAAGCSAQRGTTTRTSTPASGAAPTSLEAVLHGLFDQADVVFTGEVTAIEPTASAVEIRWRVDEAVRGAVAGQQFTLREWAGLWQADSGRYTKGQRALLLLHAASPAGYASPVGGADGVIALRGDSGSGTLDLGLLQQRVLVTDAARLRPAVALQAAGGSLALSDALQRQADVPARALRARRVRMAVGMSRSAALQHVNDDDGGTVVAADPTAIPVEASTSSPASTSVAVDASRTVDAAVVLDLLQAWQRQRGVLR